MKSRWHAGGDSGQMQQNCSTQVTQSFYFDVRLQQKEIRLCIELLIS